MSKKRKRTAEQLARDEFEFMVRRVLAMATQYQEMLASHLAREEWDNELVRRMIATRETCLLLVETAMPVPTAATKAEAIEKSRAVH